ncbi:MAG: DUF721 domain-containing protein [Sphingobium sp.]|nr:DUF721 domain-containing protein [Sphingobium sp.]
MTEGPETKSAPKTSGRKPKAVAQAPAERPRVGAARAISDLMPDIGRAAFRKFGFIQSSVVTRWAEIVGKRHAELTAPELIRFPQGRRSGGTLQLVVASGHGPMVQHIVPEIIERVNRFFGYDAVSRVSLRQGEVKAAEAVDRPPPPMLRPVPTEIGEGLREVSDPELRAVLESMARGLAAPGSLPRIR